MKLEMRFAENDRRFGAVFSEENNRMEAFFGELQYVSTAPTYDGVYEVMPDFSRQTLPTAQKLMRQDVTVEPILVSRTSNASGGTTVYIGGIING